MKARRLVTTKACKG